MYGNITESVEETIDHEKGDTFKVERPALTTLMWPTGVWTTGVPNCQNMAQYNDEYGPGSSNRLYLLPKHRIHEGYSSGAGKGPGIELTKTFSHDTFGNVITETLWRTRLTTRDQHDP